MTFLDSCQRFCFEILQKFCEIMNWTYPKTSERPACHVQLIASLRISTLDPWQKHSWPWCRSSFSGISCRSIMDTALNRREMRKTENNPRQWTTYLQHTSPLPPKHTIFAGTICMVKYVSSQFAHFKWRSRTRTFILWILKSPIQSNPVQASTFQSCILSGTF